MNGNLTQLEKTLRKIAKHSKSIKYTKGLLFAFLMTGMAAFSAETSSKDDEIDQAKDKINAWLEGPTTNRIEVVIANNDGMVLGALESLKAHQKKLPIYGVDALQEILTLVESGEVSGTVLNDGINQAKAVLDLSVNLSEGKDPIDGTEWKLEEKAVRVPYVGVDKDNVAQFKK